MRSVSKIGWRRAGEKDTLAGLLPRARGGGALLLLARLRAAFAARAGVALRAGGSSFGVVALAEPDGVAAPAARRLEARSPSRGPFQAETGGREPGARLTQTALRFTAGENRREHPNRSPRARATCRPACSLENLRGLCSTERVIEVRTIVERSFLLSRPVVEQRAGSATSITAPVPSLGLVRRRRAKCPARRRSPRLKRRSG